eukprot:Plantae.Rhodophyta-Hildenbrandia_rubra.ctg6171.p1 GENE.Plantae.Rhodophyta-Hildenbrandia_rubra.ctg6171~~Plantae.Rhodophyta-Hildenbrandia_rubra.ctg6171.p1  ORF type:complete len:805 (-),score=130.68 Plantae.Rhodophyta-Hildenbrandia_rubra.ctg6171:2098-4512(-)
MANHHLHTHHVFLTLLIVILQVHTTSAASTSLKGQYSDKAVLTPEKATLNFRVDEDKGVAYLALTITDPSTVTSDGPAYLGLGIGEQLSGSMLGSDIVTATFKEGQDDSCDVKDRYTPFEAFPLEGGGVFPEEDDCGLSDWKLVNCARDGEKGVLVLEVERGLDAGDDQDRAIGAGEQQVLYAYGKSFQYHKGNRESNTVVLFGKPVGKQGEPGDLDGDFSILNSKYALPANATTYACTSIVADVPKGGVRTIIGAEPIIEAKNTKYLHHLLVYVCEDGEYFKKFQGKTRDCGGDGPLGNPVTKCTGIAYGWAKGATKWFVPDVTGFELNDKNKFLVLETHYDNADEDSGVIDSSGAKLYYTDKRREQPGAALVVGDGYVSMSGEIVKSDWQYNSTCPKECTGLFEKSLTVFASGLHMHTTGKRIWTNHYDKDGKFIASREGVNFWSNNWQRFAPTKQWKLSPGDQLSTSCIYDTSKAPKTKWGGETKDEMCMHFLFVYPVPIRNDTGSSVYSCGMLSTGGSNETATTCGSADNIQGGLLKTVNPSFDDVRGFEDKFGQRSTCRISSDSNETSASSTDAPSSSNDTESADDTNSAESSSEGDDGPECFPWFATVELENGETTTMSELSVGDRVKVSSEKYSEVYIFSHYDPDAVSQFVQLKVKSEESNEKFVLTASHGHLIKTERGYLSARDVQVGDSVYGVGGNSLTVFASVLIESRGLFSPHTMDGDILVDGILASTYSDVLPRKVSHALLLPERISYRLGFSLYGGQRYLRHKDRTVGAGRPLMIEHAVGALETCKQSLYV